VVTRFMAHFDAYEPEGMLPLFANDGIWERADGTLEGREALGRFMATRSPGTLVRHVISNFRSTRLDAERVRVRAYVTLYRHDFSGERDLPAPLNGPSGIGEYSDELVFTAHGWLIQKKSSVLLFTTK
jgi:3-phenylpropionate/cinnamic acid dioxygenase small subunit